MSIFDNDLPSFNWPIENDFAQDNLISQSTNVSSSLLPSPFFEQEHAPKESMQNMYHLENDNYFTSFPPPQETDISHNTNPKDLWNKKADGFKFEYDQESVAPNHFYDDSTNLSIFSLFDPNKEQITILDLENQQNDFENQALPEIEEMKRHNKQTKQNDQKKIFFKKDPLPIKKNQSTKKEKQFQKTSDFVSNKEGNKNPVNENHLNNLNKNWKNNYSSQPTSSSGYKQLSQSGRSMNTNNFKVKNEIPKTSTNLQTNIEKTNCNEFGDLLKFKLNPLGINSSQLNSRKRKKILKFKKKGQYFYFSEKGYGGNFNKKASQKNGYQIKKKKPKFKNKKKIKKIQKEKEKIKIIDQEIEKEKEKKRNSKQNSNPNKRNLSNSEYFSPNSESLSFPEYISSSIPESMSDTIARSMSESESESESFSESEENFESNSKFMKKRERERTKEHVFGNGRNGFSDEGNDFTKIDKNKIKKNIISIKSPNILFKNKKIRLNFKVPRSKSFDYNDLKKQINQKNINNSSNLKLRMISSSPLQCPTVIHRGVGKRKNNKKKKENEKKNRKKKKISAYYDQKSMSTHHRHHRHQNKKKRHNHHHHLCRVRHHHRHHHHRHHRSHHINSNILHYNQNEHDQKHIQNKNKNYKNKHKNQSQCNRLEKYEKLKFKEGINSHLKKKAMKKEVKVSERMVTSEHARNIFEKWFQEKSKLETGPYPDSKTKKKLAKQSNTPIIHVNRWFAQRRRTEKIRCLNGNRVYPTWIKKKGRPRKD
ncbi:morphogenesis protein sog2 [Anaeramoeba flamelloides]|uniref:Morphogenesis protein sog2 n=1 Tax=Anaeramoeba flamelloides TaxID=1746091 RepID=A0ABQ8X311_9EUKA|nr:morphogenesis protein sog2 [Anaeramoeba flamelloides]